MIIYAEVHDCTSFIMAFMSRNGADRIDIGRCSEWCLGVNFGDAVAQNPRESARLLRCANIAMDKSTIDVLTLYNRSIVYLIWFLLMYLDCSKYFI